MMPVHRTQASYHSLPFIPVCDTLYCRDCRGGFVKGIPVITYLTGTGAEADHQLPGAIAHATVIARTRLGIKGPLQTITLAGDDDWLGEQAAPGGQAASMLQPSTVAWQNTWQHREHRGMQAHLFGTSPTRR
jgi:hypothetical protein